MIVTIVGNVFVRHLEAVILTQQGGMNWFDDHWLVHSELQRRYTAGA